MQMTYKFGQKIRTKTNLMLIAQFYCMSFSQNYQALPKYYYYYNSCTKFCCHYTLHFFLLPTFSNNDTHDNYSQRKQLSCKERLKYKQRKVFRIHPQSVMRMGSVRTMDRYIRNFFRGENIWRIYPNTAQEEFGNHQIICQLTKRVFNR